MKRSSFGVGLVLAAAISAPLEVPAGDVDFGRSDRPASATAATTSTTSGAAIRATTSAPPLRLTSQEVELVAGMMQRESKDAQARLAAQLQQEGRGELRKYLELQLLRERIRRGEGDKSLEPLLEQQARFQRERLTQQPLSVNDVDRRIEQLQGLKGESEEFRGRQEALLESYRQIKVRLTNRHGDEVEP